MERYAVGDGDLLQNILLLSEDDAKSVDESMGDAEAFQHLGNQSLLQEGRLVF